MRKFILVLLCVLLLSGCMAADLGEPTPETEGLRIVATIFPPYDFACQLGGEWTQVTMLATPGTEAHDFVPTLTDLNTVANCDLFLYIGCGVDDWAETMLESLGTGAPRAVCLSEQVELLAELPMEYIGEKEEHAHESGEMDGHIWTSPVNAAAICECIAGTMIELDPAHQSEYADNLTKYTEKLRQLDAEFTAVMAEAVRSSVVFADRMPFRYLAEELGLECYAAFRGCSSDTEPSLATIAFLTETIERHEIPVVFYLETSDQTVADTLCQATGAEKKRLHSCHNLTQAELDAGLDYLTLMQQNVEVLRAALS